MKRICFLFAAILTVAFIAGCNKDDEPTAYDLADASMGGIMYDRFWATEAGFNQSDANIAKFNAASNFFRCKQCHAWDGLGTAGSYNSRGPRTTRPNVNGINLYQMAQSKSSTELYDAMKLATGRRSISYDLSQYNPTTNKAEGDKMPNYAELLTDAQIWDIVKFMKEGMFDVTQLYDGTYTGTYPTGTAAYSNVGRYIYPLETLRGAAQSKIWTAWFFNGW